MKTFMKIGDWLPVNAWLEKAKADAFEKAGRHDVPKHVPAVDLDGKPVMVPVFGSDGLPEKNDDGTLKLVRKIVPVKPDLRDEKSRWWGAPGGGRLAAQVLLDDLSQGSHSPAIPLLRGIVILLCVLGAVSLVAAGAMKLGGHNMLATVGLGLVVLSFAGIFACLSVLWHGIGSKGVLGSLGWDVILPFLGVSVSMSAFTGAAGVLTSTLGMGGPSLSGLGMKGAMFALAVPAIMLAVIFGAVFLFTGERDKSKSSALAFAKLFLLLTVSLAICATILPGFLQPIYWVWLAAMGPYLWAKKQKKIRAYNLAYMSANFGGDDGRLGNTDLVERTKQAEAAEADKSGFIAYGIAMGIFTKYGDGYSPDKGLVVGQSPNDLMTHKHVFGKTGSGKTFNEMMVTAYDWILNDAGGMLILDGKGTLPAQILGPFLGLPNVLLIVPGVQLGLMEGLAPEEAMTAISDLAGAGATKQEQSADNEKFFNSQGKTLLLNVNLVLRALVEYGKVMEKQGADRSWHWTLEKVDLMKTLIKDQSADAEAILKAIEQVAEILPNDLGKGDRVDRMPMLRAALLYFPHNLWTMPSDTRGSVVATVETWINPLMRSPELRPWACTEMGVDPTICLRGGKVGMSLPEILYGEAGKLCQNLIRHRVMSGVRRRQNANWIDEGQTPLLFLVDEAQEMVGIEDRNFLGVARSHGGACVYATQNAEAYLARMGEQATLNFLDNFLSKAVLISSHGTYQIFSKELPEGKYISWKGAGERVIGFEQSLRKLGSHVVFDEDHELAKEMRWLRRNGAGRLVVPERRKLMLSQAQINSSAYDSYHDMDSISSMDMITTTAVVSGSDGTGMTNVRPLLTIEDCSKHLKKQTAVVKLMRGGVPRWDFIEYPTLSKQDIEARIIRVREAIKANEMLAVIRDQIKEQWISFKGEAPSKTELFNASMRFLAQLARDRQVQALEGQALFDVLDRFDLTVVAELEDRDLRNKALAKVWEELQVPFTKAA